jgi:hypothetical protein
MELSTAMLADGAQVANGKLYILGGQWDRLFVAKLPVQHSSMAVVLVIKVEYTEALTPHLLTVELMLDGHPQDVRAVGQLRTGHEPMQARGAPSYAPLALTFANVTLEHLGRYEWVITSGEHALGRLPMEVVAQENMPGLPTPAPPAPPAD